MKPEEVSAEYNRVVALSVDKAEAIAKINSEIERLKLELSR